MERVRLTIFMLIFCVGHVIAVDYHVNNQAACSDSNTATESQPWCTIQHAADTMVAGDTAYVHEGTYSEIVSLANDGSPGNEITFVAYGDDEVIVCGMDFDSTEYIRIIGFTFDSDTGSCSQRNTVSYLFGNNEYLEFWNNVYRDGRWYGIEANNLDDSCHNCLAIGNTFYDFGIGSGSSRATTLYGSNNLIAYNEVYNMHPDAFSLYGKDCRWIGNYIHDLSEESGGHSDGWQTGSSDHGISNSVIEANTLIGSGSASDEHVAQISNTQPDRCSGACGSMTELIWRGNVFHDLGSGLVGINQVDDGPITHIRYYHNTDVDAHGNYPTAKRGISWYGSHFNNAYILNNIEQETWGNSLTSGVEVYCLSQDRSCDRVGVTYTIDYNLGYDPDGSVTFGAPWTLQSNAQSNVDPGFVDYDNDDFHLTDAGGAHNNAGSLTNTVGGGTGTTVTVDDAGFFKGDNTNLGQYGGNLVVGDTITVGTDTVQIIDIDYSANEIAVTESFTWENDDPVYWGSDSEPDIGALPYRSSGYALSAGYSKQGSTVTITPNNPGLVRFVVVYEDNVPVGVDSIAPYSVDGVGDGDIEVRVYPLYATEEIVEATEQQNDCGNGICDDAETPQNCNQDCPGGGPICGDGDCNGDETCSTCPVDCTDCLQCVHEADKEPCDGCIDTAELSAYIDLWKAGSVEMIELMEVIGLWKSGC